MARFRYKAYDAKGTLAAGEVSAATREGALETLSRRGEIPFELAEAAPPAAVPWWQREIFGGGKLSSAHLAAFTRELASLVKADIPIDEALRVVTLQPMLPHRMRRLTGQCLEQVSEGAPLSGALAACGSAFPGYYVRLVRAGETGGALADVLQDLAAVVERTAETRSRIASALVYPAILLLAALAAMGVIVMVLVPTILPIFKDAGTEPPILIRALDGLARFLTKHGLALSFAIALATIACAISARSEGVRLAIDRGLLKLPLIGSLIELCETARLARTLSLLNRNGVPLLDSLAISGGVASNSVFHRAIDAAREDVRQGAPLSAPLARAGIFPDLFLRLTAVGERTGQLDAMHLRVAEIYEAAVERQAQRLTSLVTPVLTLLIGTSVGGLIISVMGAIFSVNDLALK